MTVLYIIPVTFLSWVWIWQCYTSFRSHLSWVWILQCYTSFRSHFWAEFEYCGVIHHLVGSWPTISFQTPQATFRNGWDKRTPFGRVTLLWRWLGEISAKHRPHTCSKHHKNVFLATLLSRLFDSNNAIRIDLKNTFFWKFFTLCTTTTIFEFLSKKKVFYSYSNHIIWTK
jgi:hypothetical protein